MRSKIWLERGFGGKWNMIEKKKDSTVFGIWALCRMQESGCNISLPPLRKMWKKVWRGHMHKFGSVSTGWDWWLRRAGEQNEDLLWFYRKGNMIMPTKEMRGKYTTILREKSVKHSRKPICAYEMIENMFPKTHKLEMFARNYRNGWDCWGDEVWIKI